MKSLIFLAFMMLFAGCSSDVSSVENYALGESGDNISGLSQKGLFWLVLRLLFRNWIA